MSPLVTVLIPTYRRAGYLRAAIASAQAQTLTDLRILVLDDCSPDDTAAAVAEFRSDPRVEYIRHPQNLGIAGNWKSGIAAVQSEYFCLLHDDDTFEPEFLQKLVRPLEADRSLILVFCDHWITDPAGVRLPESTAAASKAYGRDLLPEGLLADFARQALITNLIPAGAALYRRSMVQPEFIDARALGSIDMWLLYQCFRTGGGAWYLPERLMNYRSHPQGMSVSMPFHMIDGHIFRCREMLQDPLLLRLRQPLRAKLAEACEWLGMSLLRTSHFAEARAAFRQALALRVTPKAVAGWVLSQLRGAGRQLLKLRRAPSRASG